MYTWKQLSFLYNLTNPLAPKIRANWNVAPTQDVGIIVAEDGGRIYKTMRWGLVPMWSQDLKIGNNLINARVETVAEKPAFRAAYKARRCVVPASGWYEWAAGASLTGKAKAKQPFYMTSRDGMPLSFAGLWERWKGGDRLLSFTILTTEAADQLHQIHERMPLVLDAAGAEAWLAGEPPRLMDNVFAALRVYPVSRQVNKPSYNEPDCVEPLVA
jgi:putative SOS response-associated peptidase YedK